MSAPAPHEWQTAAAAAYERLGGVFVALDPGAGKTYAAALVAAKARRPLVVTPAAALDQTRAQFAQYGVPGYLVKETPWECCPADEWGVAFASYEWLTRKTQADFFERFRPTDLLLDEYHRAGPRHSAWVRAAAYLYANPEVRVGVFTGSPMDDQLERLASGLTWALRGHVRDFVPQTKAGVELLAARLATSELARLQFQARLRSQPGVWLDVGDVGRYAGAVELRVVRREPVAQLPDTWELPDGFLVDSAAYAAELNRMLAWGYWPTRSPRPSEGYLAARRQWFRTVRRLTEAGVVQTEAQVRELRPFEYSAWAEVEAAERLGETEYVWVTPATGDIGDLLQTDGRRIIIWADHRELQEAVSARLGVPLHREHGRDADGVRLDETRAPVVVASIDACHAGFNAQHFNHQLWLELPSDPEKFKQGIGRSARQGQTAPRVTVDLVVNCAAAEAALRTALDRAEQRLQTVGKTNPILQLKNRDW